jgi:hypothetical protein
MLAQRASTAFPGDRVIEYRFARFEQVGQLVNMISGLSAYRRKQGGGRNDSLS